MDIRISYESEYNYSVRKEEDLMKVLTRVFVPKTISIKPRFYLGNKVGHDIDLRGCDFVSSDSILSKLKNGKIVLDTLLTFEVTYSEDEHKKLNRSIVAEAI